MSDDSSPSAIPEAELGTVLGATLASCRVERLVHNPRNAVTEGVWRVRSGRDSAILKVLTNAKVPESKAWAVSENPSHWNYWRREALFYQSSLAPLLAHEGIGAPRLLGVFDRSATRIALWLEDVAGERGDGWSVADHVAVSRALGRAQAVAAADAEWAREAWLSRGFLRCYSDKPVQWSLLEDDTVWSRPLVAECLGPLVRAAGLRLVAEREWLLGVMEGLPRTLCHLDFWPMNLIRRPTGEMVALDWAFVGDGALGEDLGNHVPDSAFDLFTHPSDLVDLDRVTFEAFTEGLRDGGWVGEERSVRLALCASAVKYVWLLPHMLERAIAQTHSSYGGSSLSDPRKQFRARGETLLFLDGWVDEAHRLAG